LAVAVTEDEPAGAEEFSQHRRAAIGRRNRREKLRAHVVPFARKKRNESMLSFDDGCRSKVGFAAESSLFETGRDAWTSLKVKIFDLCATDHYELPCRDCAGRSGVHDILFWMRFAGAGSRIQGVKGDIG
jgi:hypothetical protein